MAEKIEKPCCFCMGLGSAFGLLRTRLISRTAQRDPGAIVAGAHALESLSAPLKNSERGLQDAHRRLVLPFLLIDVRRRGGSHLTAKVDKLWIKIVAGRFIDGFS